MTSPSMMKNFPDIPDSSADEKLLLNNASGIEVPVKKPSLISLLEIVENDQSVQFSEIELVYVDEEEIIRVNREFLDHDYVTDIITFRYDEETDNSEIEATLYCCAPRIIEQSNEFKTDTETEFLRVFVHGLIHLAGYNDQTEEEKKRMTTLENRYLELLNPEL